MPSVLFVCTANQCRSPMAAALFKHRLSQAGLGDGWCIESAGTWALEGMPAAELAQRVMLERGLDLADHRSRLVSAEMLAHFDLILVMEPGHLEALQAEFPHLANRVRLLSSVVGLTHEIVDPVKAGLETYRALAKELADLLDCGFERILTMTGWAEDK